MKKLIIITYLIIISFYKTDYYIINSIITTLNILFSGYVSYYLYCFYTIINIKKVFNKDVKNLEDSGWINWTYNDFVKNFSKKYDQYIFQISSLLKPYFIINKDCLFFVEKMNNYELQIDKKLYTHSINILEYIEKTQVIKYLNNNDAYEYEYNHHIINLIKNYLKNNLIVNIKFDKITKIETKINDFKFRVMIKELNESLINSSIKIENKTLSNNDYFNIKICSILDEKIIYDFKFLYKKLSFYDFLYIKLYKENTN